MTDNHHVLLTFEFHDYRLQPHHDITVRLSTTVSVVKLVFVPVRKVVWICLLHPKVNHYVGKYEGKI
jgi:hypothetical protein